MNAKISDQLKIAAATGDVNLLYAVIQDDPNVLENIDKQQFVETPLHIAASMGHLPFAIEVMNLKPSFALKLNPQGFSPIHLAMQNLDLQNGLENLVLRFVFMNKDLVNIKGRGGFTLLHFAVQIGKVELLAKFLIVCPESIEHLTAGWETALHIAVKNKQYEALDVLVSWLKTNTLRGADKLENYILNQMDVEGNTILHLSVLYNEPQVSRLLVKTRINLNAKNLYGKTALDLAANNVEIERILLSAKAKSSPQISDAPTLAHKLRSSNTIWDKVFTCIFRITRDISGEQRDSWLVVATLIATATFESILNPPGGVYQANANDNNVNITSSNSTITNTNPGNVGKSVMPKDDFFLFLFLNMLSFFASFITIIFLIPRGRQVIVNLLAAPIIFFLFYYAFSVYRISPTNGNSIFVFTSSSIIFVIFIFIAIAVYSILQRRRNLKKLMNKLMNKPELNDWLQ